MNSQFDNFISKTESSLRDHLKKGELKEFSDKLIMLYRTSIKFFADETEDLLRDHGVSKLLANIKRSSLTLMSEYKAYEVQESKIVLEKKYGTKEEYPIINVGDFVKKALDMNENSASFFLITSYLMSTLNYDALQLFGIYLSKA